MATPRPLNTVTLPARIFHAAMQRQLSLDAYAATLDVPADALRALLSAQADQLTPELLSQLAAAHGQKAEAGIASLTEVVAGEAFSTWLARHMEGVSQTALRTRAQLDAPLLRAFLSGKSLPDADQAERIARALYIDSAEMARIIVADMARRAERPRKAPVHGPDEQQAPGPATPDSLAPARARRRKAPESIGAPTAATAAPPPPTSSNGAVQAEPAPEDTGVAEPVSGRRRGAARVSAAPAATPAPPAGPPAGETASESQAAAAGANTPSQAEADTAPAPTRRKDRKAAAAPLVAAPMEGLGDESAPAAPPAARAARGRRAAPSAAQGEGAPAAAGGIRASAEPPPPAQAGATVALPTAPPPMVAAEVSSAETTLQLSPDEVRLIRTWRRLHPHGQRATLQYIGSLLVEG